MKGASSFLSDPLPLAGVLPWLVSALAVLVLAPAAVGLGRWRSRSGGRVDDERSGEGGADRPANRRVAQGNADDLSGAAGPQEATAALLDAARALPGVDAALLALAVDDGVRATGYAARGADEQWRRSLATNLESDATGLATAARERAAFAVYDLSRATDDVSRALARTVGAKSAAYVPLLARDRVVGVLVLASVAERRLFASDELATAQRSANEVGSLLAQTGSADALRRALAREKLVTDIARKVRSEVDVDAVLQTAVAETARAMNVARAFIRLGGFGEAMPVRAEWRAPDVPSIAQEPDSLPVSNLAAQQRRTIAIGDVRGSPELAASDPRGRDALVALGSCAVLATPIVVFDRMIGVFSLHRTEMGAWSATEISLAEAVAGEVGVALHAARLLEEDERRLGQQAALLTAAQVVTSDLRFESVLRRLVYEVATLFSADAADCWMFEPDGETLRCRAVYGLPEIEVGRRIPPGGTFAAAIDSAEPVLKRDFARTEDPPPSANFADFEEVMVAPMTWLGEVRGVLGVCSREAGRFDASEVDLLAAFARFASLAAHNAESFEERERQARIQQGFYRIAEVLGSPLSLAETLDALAQAAAEALGAESAVVVSPDGDGLSLAGSYGAPSELAGRLADGIAANATPFAPAARDERIVSSTGLADDERFDLEFRGLLRSHGYEALLSAPVQRSTENVAVVVLFRKERTFADDDLVLARHLSRAARGALERSELFEAERRARSLSQRLATVSARVATALEPALVLEEVARAAAALVDADAAAICLLERDELVVRATAGAATAIAGTRAALAAGVLGDVVQSRRAVAIEDVRARPQAARGDPLLGETMAACVAVPVAARAGGLHGVLSVYAAAPRTWGSEEVQALVALAAMASTAVANAELYRRVAEEKERSDAILGNIADGIVAVDRDGRIVLWNATAEQITGVPAAEAFGRGVGEVLQRELASEAGGVAGEREVAIVRGGKEVWLSLTEAVMRDAEGTVLGRIFAFRDVSSERAVEQMKSDFVATVSHELRTPLTSIYGFAETLLRSDVAFGEEERATFLGYIASESERLIGIVDDLLNVARLDAGTLGVEISAVDVGALVRETVERFAAGVDGDHRFVVEVADEGLVAEADPARLAEVVRHLVDNAVKYSPKGGTILVSGRRTADAVEVRVVDEGVGIPPGDHQRVFTKFFRVQAGPLAAAPGTGIGLFLARGLLAAMNGRIWFESSEGEGSSFVFELPVSNSRATGM